MNTRFCIAASYSYEYTSINSTSADIERGAASQQNGTEPEPQAFTTMVDAATPMTPLVVHHES